jgi:hypothetical protein
LWRVTVPIDPSATPDSAARMSGKSLTFGIGE